MHQTLTVAAKEFRDGLRNRWVIALTILFALLSVGVSYFGAVASGQIGFTPLPTTIASLTSLATFLVPLIALLLAFDAIVGERESGTLALLLSYPLEPGQLVLGKFLGHGAILLVSTSFGFGVAGLLIQFFSPHGGAALWTAFGLFIGSATLLGLDFLAIGYAVSAGAIEKSRAAGLALILWFLCVLVFDIALLGLLVAGDGQLHLGQLLPYLLMLNPTDVFRLVNLHGLPTPQSYSEIGAMTGEHHYHMAALVAVLLAWALVPCLIAAWRLRRCPI